MNKKAIIGLAALVFVLFLVTAALLMLKKPGSAQENKDKTGNTSAKSSIKSLSDFSYLDISGIDIERPDGLLKLRQSNQIWILEDDPAFDLDQNSAVAVATNCSYLSAEESVPAKSANLSDFGLSPAQYTIQVYLKDGSTLSFLIGLQTMDKKGRYAMVKGGDKIVVIPDYADKAFTTPKADMINRSVGSIDWAHFAKLAIKRPGEADLVIEMNEEPSAKDSQDVVLKYIETSPYKTYASPELMKNLFKDLPQLSFDAYITTAADALTYGLETPRMSMSVMDDSGNQMEIHFGNSFEKEGEVFYYCNRARDTQNIFALSEKKADQFLGIMPLSAIDSLPLPQLAEETPKKISVVSNGKTDVIDIKGSDLTLNGVPLTDEKSKKILVAYYDIRISSPAQNAAKGEPYATITADFGTRTAKVEYYPFDEKLYVVDQGLGLTVGVSKQNVERFLASLETQ